MRLDAVRRLLEKLRSPERADIHRNEQFTVSELNIGRMVLPLIQDLEAARKTIDELTQRGRATGVALGLVPFAALLIDESGQLLSTNSYTRTLFGGPAVPLDVISAARRALIAGEEEVAISLGGNGGKLRIVPAEIDEDVHGVGVVFLIPEDAKTSIDTERLVTRYGLTPAQSRVAALVAQGLSNREVAEELSISPQTVHTHMQTILSKTQVTNRAALVAVVFGARFARRARE